MSNNKIIVSLIKRDFAYGFRKNLLKYISIIIIFIIINCLKINNLSRIYNINRTELFFEIFKGVPYYVNMNDFQFPFIWFTINCFMAFIIGDYVYDDLQKNGIYLLTRIKKIRYFWISKVIWIISSVLVYYALLFGITLVLGKLFLNGYPEWSLFKGVKISTKDILINFALLYVTTSVSLALFQVSLSLIVKPINSYLITIIVVLLSAFVISNFIPAQHSLILRHVPFDPVHRLTLYKSLVYNCIFSSCSFIVGYMHISKKDII